MTRAGSADTSASTCWPPEVRTGTSGKARPSSSAVRVAPVTSARSRSDPHRGQAQSAARAPHHRQPGTSLDPPTRSGPPHTAHRAWARQRAQAIAARYPRRGTWTRTGPGRAVLSRAALLRAALLRAALLRAVLLLLRAVLLRGSPA